MTMGRPRNETRVPRCPSFVIAAANTYVGIDLGGDAPRDENGELAGTVPGTFLREVRAFAERFPFLKEGESPVPMSWDAAFAWHVGYWSLYGGVPARSSWPLPPAATAADFERYAKEKRMVVEEPLAGDLFLLWSPAQRTFVRTGIVINVYMRDRLLTVEQAFVECEVIEGDSSPDRSLIGGRILRQKRKFGSRDRFIRWSEPRNASPGHELDDQLELEVA